MYDAGRKGCLELLENGFVHAFEETLELIETNEKIKTHAELGLDKEKPQDLSKDSEVMKTIMEMLKKSEEADRTGAIEDEYSARLEIANNLRQQSGYYWLAEYLYKTCFRVLDTEDKKHEKSKIKALQLLALLEERRDNHDVALRYMEKAIKLVKETPLEPDDPFRKELFQQLIRMYRKLGTQYLNKETETTDTKESKAIFYYKKAVSLAKTTAVFKAYEQFETGYRILLFSGETLPDLLKLCRVMCGIGRANRSFDCLISILQDPPEKALNQLLTWRNTGGSFEGKIMMKNDHLIDLSQEEIEDADTKRAKLIQKLISEEKKESQEHKSAL
ncbi:hypothetical protein HNY73_020077 [Argiope bruennichi]|uniref:Tetratricopeptide repeat protein 29 n=1 Tax=Argiope bruennichi TaxID=94029 RepID=A0A8T0E6R7_ARGBR|nr:hypothetical protein HNY73_020077 [Argiope bruennichi]